MTAPDVPGSAQLGLPQEIKLLIQSGQRVAMVGASNDLGPVVEVLAQWRPVEIVAMRSDRAACPAEAFVSELERIANMSQAEVAEPVGLYARMPDHLDRVARAIRSISDLERAPILIFDGFDSLKSDRHYSLVCAYRSAIQMARSFSAVYVVSAAGWAEMFTQYRAPLLGDAMPVRAPAKPAG